MALWAKKPVLAAYPEELRTLGDHLRKKRLDLKMLQKEVAKRCGTTVCTVRNWEKNRSSPFLIFIPKIIQFLGYVPYDTSEQNFGKKIAAKRRLLGLSQKDLACKIGVDPCTTRSWEKGRNKPKKKLLKKLAAFLIQSILLIIMPVLGLCGLQNHLLQTSWNNQARASLAVGHTSMHNLAVDGGQEAEKRTFAKAYRFLNFRESISEIN